MIVDSSAIIAVLYQEADAMKYTEALSGPEKKFMSVANVLEVSILLQDKRNKSSTKKLNRLLEEIGIQLCAVNIKHYNIAAKAYQKYGKGNHKAALNFGDCFAYALAKEKGLPLLYKGNDFSKTDIKSLI